MKKKGIKIVWAIGILIFAGCQSLDLPKKPDNLIDEDCMAELLTEIAFLKAAKSSYKKKMEVANINPEAYILEKYEIDSITFAESNNWYVYDLKTYEKIFKDVTTNVKLSQMEVEKAKKVEDSIKKVRDSIKKAEEVKK